MSRDVDPALYPVLSLICGVGGGALGAWIGVTVKITRLETRMGRALSDIRELDRDSARHNEDLLVHDMELNLALKALKIPRQTRQRLRDWGHFPMPENGNHT
jgi:hypothetical protein